ncbi:hypothetical protein LWI29_007571 [Acer saccharum]|uniref:Uncharacterized protein n=1 Tax=Acer saccharum TaxID=4024 RepID=A0AA39SRN7_ACESA|nr:hypothetical protein LWI29_007571 [Acer saccharum]
MEKAKDCLELNEEESETVSRLTIHPHRVVGSTRSSFYEVFTLRGIRVDRVEPGLVSCTFKVPPRFTDNNGNLANGAIANLVDESVALWSTSRVFPGKFQWTCRFRLFRLRNSMMN